MRKVPASKEGHPFRVPLEPRPARRTTPTGVVMSERMSRIYGWLVANGIYLTPFSTDRDVDTEFSRLEQAERYLKGLEQTQHVIDMLGDLACIMRRRSAARVTGVR